MFLVVPRHRVNGSFVTFYHTPPCVPLSGIPDAYIAANRAHREIAPGRTEGHAIAPGVQRPQILDNLAITKIEDEQRVYFHRDDLPFLVRLVWIWQTKS